MINRFPVRSSGVEWSEKGLWGYFGKRRVVLNHRVGSEDCLGSGRIIEAGVEGWKGWNCPSPSPSICLHFHRRCHLASAHRGKGNVVLILMMGRDSRRRGDPATSQAAVPAAMYTETGAYHTFIQYDNWTVNDGE
ncbi:hypothetical protein J6590_048578 [Homalodisca vitripennis]|nr:hypothetical protein J6590_048578 [Homalodisca vitripennis]